MQRRQWAVVALAVFVAVLACGPAPTHADLTSACRPASPNCALCDTTKTTTEDVTFCYQCTDARYLYDGACHATCKSFAGTAPYGSGTVNRVCRPRCGYGSYDASPESTEPLCIAWQVCPDGTHEDAPPGAAVDRSCANNTACAAVGKEFEIRAPGPSSDRLCRAVTPPCDLVTEYQSSMPTATSDRSCLPLTVCVDGEYESRRASPSSDRACAAIASCAAVGVEFEVAAPTATSNRVCAPVSTCAAVGVQYTAAAATATSDRRCANVTTCGPVGAAFEAAPATASTDAVCANCTTCPAQDARVVAACSRDADTVCTACPSACPENTFRARPCDGMSGGDDGCEPCSVCQAGVAFAATACRASADTDCQQCTPCDLEGNYIADPCTPTSDTDCRPLTRCDPATEVETVSASATSDRECAPAPPCGVDSYETAPPTATTVRTCAPLSTCIGFCSGGLALDGPCACGPSCNTCLLDRDAGMTACALCTNSRYLFDGACLSVCPLGFVGVGAPSPFGRQCVPSAAGAELPAPTLAVEYQRRAPSATSDRACSPVTECGDARFQTASYTATSDRQCQNYTVCGEDEFEVEPPGIVSDR